jgi:hypothetical protein
MAEKSSVIAALMGTSRFRDRIRAIVANKASTILAEASPDADQLTWAKAAISSGYDAWVESVLLLVETKPTTVEAAMSATDAQLAVALNTVFAQVVKAKV